MELKDAKSYGSSNKIVSNERYDELKKRLKDLIMKEEMKRKHKNSD